MIPVEVTVRFSLQGEITPLAFSTHGTRIPIHGLGRRWQDESGHHFLVMAPEGQVVALHFRPGEGRWYLQRPPPGRTAA